MTVLAVFSVMLAAGTYIGIVAGEKYREIDADIRGFLADLDRERQ
mgnify:CR=1 FL=1